jgi:hypothetical protein
MFLVFYISQSTLGAWIAEGYEFEDGTAIPGLVTLLEAFQGSVAELFENAHPLLSAILVSLKTKNLTVVAVTGCVAVFLAETLMSLL